MVILESKNNLSRVLHTINQVTRNLSQRDHYEDQVVAE